jgi:mannan endo-1,4-beta-mannosidase
LFSRLQSRIVVPFFFFVAGCGQSGSEPLNDVGSPANNAGELKLTPPHGWKAWSSERLSAVTNGSLLAKGEVPSSPPDPNPPPNPPPPNPNPPPSGDGTVPRPSSVLSQGFYVAGGQIIDPSGHPFLARGINHTHWWGDQTANFNAINELPKTGANIIRAVFGPGFGVTTPDGKRAVVAQYAANHMPVIVEDHGATCGTDPGQISSIVDGWLDPGNVSWLNDYEKNVILNIANEWGPPDDNVWASTYETAIQRLRAGGVHNMILLDAGGNCGQFITTIVDKWQEIEQADPEHNVAFSVHMYGFWRTPEATDVGSWGSDGTPFSIHDQLANAKALGIPLVVGEMGWEQDSQVLYKTKPALQIFHDLGIGFIGWSWNQNSDSTYDFRAGGGSNYTYSGPQDLTDGGKAIILDPDYGIQVTAVPAGGV